MSLFGKKDQQLNGLQMAFDAVRNYANSKPDGQVFAKSVGGRMIAMESLDSVASQEVESSMDDLNVALENINTSFGNKYQHLSATQHMSAKVAAMISSDQRSQLQTGVAVQKIALENAQFIPAMTGLNRRVVPMEDGSVVPALEAYDERENKATTIYTIAYNMQAARQDEFGEAFFPTVVVTPDQYGYTLSVRLIQVYDEVRRSVSGAVSKNFGKKNIIKAVIDPSILRNDTSKIIPVVRPESEANFVDPALIPPTDVTYEGETVSTAPLAFGKQFSLIGLSQTDALLETGILDSTDAIDPAIRLGAVYLEAGSDVVKFGNLQAVPEATFVHAQQGNYRKMVLQFDSTGLTVNQNTKTVAGGALVTLAPIVTGNLSVKLAVSIFGSVQTELGDTVLNTGNVSVYSITDEDGDDIALDGTQGAQIVALFASAKFVGYDLDSRRTNTNRRERGQLLDLTFQNMVYGVPLLSPITIPRPMTMGDQNDASDLAALITTTHIRTSNAAVAKLLESEQLLAERITTNGVISFEDPEIGGIGRLLVTPYYEHQDFDALTAVDSLTSTDRAGDVQNALINVVRDIAYRMYRDSGYKAAADAMTGGIAPIPTVIIGTDPVISRYLQVVGDFRTLGNEFQVKVVSTLNIEMKNKILFSFGMFGEGEGVANPLHFGNMAWKPELTLVLPLHRNGANSKEITAQPSFLHVMNMPVLGSITVSNIDKVVSNKVAINNHPV